MFAHVFKANSHRGMDGKFTTAPAPAFQSHTEGWSADLGAVQKGASKQKSSSKPGIPLGQDSAEGAVLRLKGIHSEGVASMLGVN